MNSNPAPGEILKLIEQGRHLTTKQAALYLNLSERTLEAYRYLRRDHTSSGSIIISVTLPPVLLHI